jgi:lipoate-protein ligase B
VSLDPQPFDRINVCGYKDLRVTRLVDHGILDAPEKVAMDLLPHLLRQLGFYSAINTDLHAVNSR